MNQSYQLRDRGRPHRYSRNISFIDFLEDDTKYLPMRVDLCGVDAKLLLGDTNDNGECLIDLELCDVVDLEAGTFEGSRESKGRRLREVDGIDTGVGVCYEILLEPCVYPRDRQNSQMTFARGLMPSSRAFSADMRMRADAPSFKLDEFAG